MNRFILPCILLVFSIITGFWLSKKGRPLNNAVFSLHKIIAVAAIVFIAMQIYREWKGGGLHDFAFLSIIATGFLFFIVLVSGAFLSFDKFANIVLRIIHRFAAILFTAGVAFAIYMLIR